MSLTFNSEYTLQVEMLKTIVFRFVIKDQNCPN